MGVEALQGIQAGKQTLFGTAVTDTVKMMAFQKFRLNPIVDGQVLEDIRASLQPGFLQVVKAIEGAAAGDFFGTYEDINYALEAMFGEVTPTGAGPYTRNGQHALGTAPTLRKQTLYHGDATGTYRLTGAIGSTLALKFARNDVLKGSMQWKGQRITTGTLAALSDRTVNPIMGDQCKVYVDAWGGTIGTTAIDDTAFSAELSFQNEIIWDRSFNSLYPVGYFLNKAKPDRCRLKLSLEFDAVSKAYVDEIIVGTAHQKQIRFDYNNGANLRARFDFAGVATKAPSAIYDYENGLGKVDIEYQGMYNPTLANFFKYSTINSVSALP